VHRNEGGSPFRAKAMQHYARSREKGVVPKFISLRVVPYFWILISLLMVGLVIASMIEIPIYTSALGLVIDGHRFPEVDDRVVLAVFVPSDGHPDLHEGQDVLVQFFQDGDRINQTVVAVMPEVLSPAMARQRFDLPEALAALIDRPAYIAIVRVQPIPGNYLPPADAGGVYRVDLRAGSLRLITLLPGIGSLFRD
jgi:hypothetical protein